MSRKSFFDTETSLHRKEHDGTGTDARCEPCASAAGSDDQKKREQATWSEKRFLDIVNNIQSIVLRIDINGTITFINRFAADFLGYTQDELLGKCFQGTITPAIESSGRNIEPLFEQLLKNPEELAYNENEVIRKDGSRAMILWTNKPLYDENGVFQELFCIGSDITAKTEFHRQMEALTRNVPGLLFQLRSSPDGTNRLLYSGGVVREALSRKESTFFNDEEEAFFNLVFPDDRDTVRATLARAGAICGDWMCEFRIKLEENSLLWVHARATPVREADGSLLWHGYLADVTARKELEHELREQLSLQEQIFSLLPIPLVMKDVHSVYIQVNKAFAEFIGLPKEEIVGKGPFDLLLPEFAEQIYEEDREIVRSKEPRTDQERRMKNARGEDVWLKSYKGPLFNRQGEVIGIVGGNMDISALKNAEEQILHQAMHDMLTGLPNRMLFNDRLLMAMADGKRLGKTTALIFLDLDNFKIVNDTLGHHAGDLLLMAVSKRLAEVIRGIDTLARLGGDEFAFVLPFLDAKESAAIIADRIREALRSEFRIDGRSLFISGSLGIALHPDDGDDVETLMRQADMAMYRAKREGRDTWRFWR